METSGTDCADLLTTEDASSTISVLFKYGTIPKNTPHLKRHPDVLCRIDSLPRTDQIFVKT